MEICYKFSSNYLPARIPSIAFEIVSRVSNCWKRESQMEQRDRVEEKEDDAK